jgi:hypothetical protein
LDVPNNSDAAQQAAHDIYNKSKAEVKKGTAKLFDY